VITGTGRAGTTLLVRVFRELGLDTGLDEGKLTPYAPTVRAGLECRVDDPDAPMVVKDMTLGFRMRAVLESGAVRIGHVVIPTRQPDIAAASRIRAAGYGRLPFRRGALTGTMRATEQEQVLVRMRAEIVGALTDFGIPYTDIEFPRFATDAAYTHGRLGFLVPGATLDDFDATLERCVRPEMIHESALTGREVWRTRLTTVWMRVVRFPIARVRQRFDPEGQKAKLRSSVAEARRREAMLAEVEQRPSGVDRPTPPS